MNITKTEKIYIGRTEAFEINTQRGNIRLPRKGRETWTVRSNIEPCLILGKDEQGYYLQETINAGGTL